MKNTQWLANELPLKELAACEADTLGLVLTSIVARHCLRYGIYIVA